MTGQTSAMPDGRGWPRMRARLRTTGRAPLQRLARSVDFVAGARLSVRAKILISLCIVIVLMSITNVMMLFQWLNYSRQYDAIINNITAANSISGQLKADIDTEMWKVVSGKINFRDGRQYQIILDTDAQLQRMIANTDSHRARVKLDVIRRTLGSLTEQIDLMGQQIEQKSTASENEAVLEKIRFSSTVLDEVVQDYTLFEVQRTEEQYQLMRQGLARWQLWNLFLLFSAVLFSVLAAWGISRSIYLPIKKLHDVTTTITRTDLQALMTGDNVDEIAELGMSFNIMIGKIRDLVDSKLKEHEELKKAELRALQAQINPHFLYNTLDTIIWMAEANRTAEVIEIVRALSSFFRLSLSKGRDWITIGEELERTRSYLTIQKIRYRDILDYKIDVDEAVLDNTILKLSLQPLVENALYHGIKNKRRGGAIIVRARPLGSNEVLLQVEDDGVGLTPEKLAQVQAGLAEETDEISADRGFGIDNVNKRTRLYYGKPYGLSIQSEYQVGTCVSLVIPARQDNGATAQPAQ
jgi:two-component system sensor histidine kinase YesM